MEQNLEQMEQSIKDGEVLQVRITDRLHTLEGQYKQYAEELKKLGIKPETALSDIQKKEKEFQEGIENLAKRIPVDLINQYKNYNFSDNNAIPQNTDETPF